jgi:hypothetical protein
MDETTTNSGNDQNGSSNALGSIASELKRESDRLLHLAAQLEADQKVIAELTAERDHFRRLAHAWAAEQFDKQQPSFPEKDVETLAREENALPLDSFIAELERIVQGHG